MEQRERPVADGASEPRKGVLQPFRLQYAFAHRLPGMVGTAAVAAAPRPAPLPTLVWGFFCQALFKRFLSSYVFIVFSFWSVSWFDRGAVSSSRPAVAP